MPVEVDLGQFPRVRCARCGFVALVDPALPRDVVPSLTCPNCRGRLTGRQAAGQSRRRADAAPIPTRGAARRTARVPRGKIGPPTVDNGPVPSHAAVGLALAALFLLVLMGAFAWLLLTPHQHYWWALH